MAEPGRPARPTHPYPPNISFDSANGPSVMGSFHPRTRARRRRALPSIRGGAAGGRGATVGSSLARSCVSCSILTSIVRSSIAARRRTIAARTPHGQNAMSRLPGDDCHRGRQMGVESWEGYDNCHSNLMRRTPSLRNTPVRHSTACSPATVPSIRVLSSGPCRSRTGEAKGRGGFPPVGRPEFPRDRCRRFGPSGRQHPITEDH